MISVTADVDWNVALERDLVVNIPAAAHREAAAETARHVAAKAGHATGRLAADLATPTQTSPTSSDIGSNLVYAGIQNHGGTITPKRSPRLLIHAGPGGTGPVVASADRVFIRGSNYLDQATDYLNLMTSELAARMPHAT